MNVASPMGGRVRWFVALPLLSLTPVACNAVFGIHELSDGGDAGEGGAGTLSVAPASFAFSTLKAGTTGASERFTVQNNGGATVPTLTIAITPSSGTVGNEFSIAADGCSGKPLGAVSSCDVAVQFAPGTHGSKSALLSVNAGQARAQLTGTGEDTLHLSVSKGGSTGGTVTDASGLINCGATCSADFTRTTSNPVVKLTASPDATSTFQGWTGAGCSQAPVCDVTLNADTAVEAHFLEVPVLTVNFRPIGAGVSGSISSTPPGISCSGPCTASAAFPSGTQVALTVSGVSPSTLVGWLPTSCSGSACSITMSSAQTVNYTATGNNIVFLTAAAKSADLGGLTGAISLCNTAAADAGLPGHYVPWLATTAASAATGLGSARGWIRVDGLPFADTVGTPGGYSGLINGQIFYPPGVDAYGSVSTAGNAWTGAEADGAAVDTCGDWTTSSVSFGRQGSVVGGTGVWTDEFSRGCSEPASIYCLGTDLTTPIDAFPQTGRHAFLSKASFNPSTGLAGADEICQNEANSAGLPNAGHFRALLASLGAAAISRFDLTGAAWIRPDGVRITTAASNIGSGPLLATISQLADGEYVEPSGRMERGSRPQRCR